MAFIRYVVKRLLICLLLYQIPRILFLFVNKTALIPELGGNMLWVFLMGLRFDLAIIATFLVCVFVFEVIALFLKSSSLFLIAGFVFFLANFLVLGFGVVDAKLISFTGRRMTPDFFGIANDIFSQSLTIALNYWWFTIVILGFAALLGFALLPSKAELSVLTNSPLSSRSTRKKNISLVALQVFCLLAFLVVAARGGLQTRPLSPSHAFAFEPSIVSNLILNSGMTMLRTPLRDTPTVPTDFQSIEDAKKVILTERFVNNRGTLSPLEPSKPFQPFKNVVLIIVESLATEYVGFFNEGKGYTPFLDDLFSKSIVFENSFANGRRSIDALPAIFAGIPAWRDAPFVTSSFQGNRIIRIPKDLKQLANVSSSFFHGASNGSMHFDVLTSMTGFDRYIGLNEYPDKKDFDGHWGVFDGPFFNFFLNHLDKEPSRFFNTIFTLTSHDPFPIPKEYESKFPKGTLPNHETIGYIDKVLKDFFEDSKSKPWFPETVFIITGDHTSQSDDVKYQNILGRYRVPIVIFDPSNRIGRPGIFKDVAQHIDIPFTVMDLMGIKPASIRDRHIFGRSLLDKNALGVFVQNEDGRWLLYDGTQMYSLSRNKSNQADLLPNESLQGSRVIDPARLNLLKAYRQYFVQGLVEDSWAVSEPN